MCMSPVTVGLSRSRSSCSAFGTIMMPGCWMACAQNEIAREVSTNDTPTRDLNHWRCSSTRVMSAIGVPQMWEASRVRSSKLRSGAVSRIRYSRSAASRVASSAATSRPQLRVEARDRLAFGLEALEHVEQPRDLHDAMAAGRHVNELDVAPLL